MTSVKAIGPFEQIITLQGMPMKGCISDDQIEVLQQNYIIVEEGLIIDLCDANRMHKDFPDIFVEEITTPMTLLPGFIDAHTHICFAGSRAQDYAYRLNEMSYLEIAQQGGGIWNTVMATRNTSKEDLIAITLKRAEQMLSKGITTIEVKSGYGLSMKDELGMLEVIAEVNNASHADIVPTCLAAHIKPKDFTGSSRLYLDSIIEELLPEIKEKKLTNRVDIFIEETAFSFYESQRFLQKAKDMGFTLTVHADQFTTGACQLAVALGAISADHLEAINEEEIKNIAASDTVATVLPGASIGLGMAFAPARSLLDQGACLAIASDWNPGSAPMGNLLVQACIMGAAEKLTLAETMAGLTYRASKALGLVNRGRIERGFLADMQAYPTKDYKEIFYLQGMMDPTMVWKKGKPIHAR